MKDVWPFRTSDDNPSGGVGLVLLGKLGVDALHLSTTGRRPVLRGTSTPAMSSRTAGLEPWSRRHSRARQVLAYPRQGPRMAPKSGRQTSPS